MDIDKHYLIMLISMIILYITLCYKQFNLEKFIQTMDYLQEEQLYECEMDYGVNSNKCRKLRYGEEHLNNVIRHGFNRNPNIFNEYTNSTNEPILVGYLYSQDTQNNDMFNLYKLFDYKRGKYGYAYKESKYRDDYESILTFIDPKKYNNSELYTDDVINITEANVPFVVKLYEIKSVGIGTRYKDKGYRDSMYEYGILRPNDPTQTVNVEDKYFILYRQTLDPRREQYNYYIKDKYGVLLELDNKKSLDDGDTIMIPGKEQYGEYKLKVYDN